jgi:hypothetical protein
MPFQDQKQPSIQWVARRSVVFLVETPCFNRM